ncbi:TPA_asm: hypothetical protein ES702_05913 [Lokiarchaeia virus SkuldV3]|uniref:Uncharacterized protein n=1 Tax=Lokiarchaeia virus SkuldV3 TaxID=2983915 RepID=A0A9N7AB76_9VIRU|nr:hypothetical protein QKT74_gp10 [Lokiarchaeia virus SkuldV3]DAZ90950.1 TPA_asm: hypothetical protein ES702_05913 [Lokiarchaeia virus SkuldV3]
MKPLTKKSKQTIGATVGIGAAGITAYLIYKYLTKKKDEEFIPDPAEEEFEIPEIPISLENIMLIIQDVTLTQMEKIAILEAMYNEQFFSMEFQQTEILQIESELQYIDEQIAQVLIDVVPYETQVAAKLSELTVAQTAEATAYNAYIVENNYLNFLLNELAKAETALDKCAWWDLACQIHWALKVENRQGNVNVQEAITSNAWNVYLDKEQLRKEAENEYNSAILALELFKEENLFTLQEEKIVLTNSLNMWKIAYQAANNILTELITQLEILGVSV